jgi:hypothetical protein
VELSRVRLRADYSPADEPDSRDNAKIIRASESPETIPPNSRERSSIFSDVDHMLIRHAATLCMLIFNLANLRAIFGADTATSKG